MEDDEQPRPTGANWALAAAVLLVVTGTMALTVGLHAQHHAPQPSAAAGSPAPPSPGPHGSRSRPGPILNPAAPLALTIPSIRVHSDLMNLGQNSDGSAQVPPLTAKANAGWYRYSPTPGQRGPAIILGHVDSAKYGPGVFFDLGALRPGATVSITRTDHTVAVFRVQRVVAYPKNNFPTFDVYANTTDAALRLITCGGKFNTSTHSYESNIVAYAAMVSSHHA